MGTKGDRKGSHKACGDKGVEEWKKEGGLRNSRNVRECHYVPKPQEKTLCCICGGAAAQEEMTPDTRNIRGLSYIEVI